MAQVMTTKMSSKGQIVLPEALRRTYGWQNGTAFTVLVYNGAVIMQPLKTPTEEEIKNEFEAAFEESRRLAVEAGMQPLDIANAISEVRVTRRNKRTRR